MSKIICVGEILWDALPQGLFLGGAPFNAACHLHALEEEVCMVSRLGKDVLGEQALKRIREKNMSADLIQHDAHQPTGLVDVELDQKGIPSYKIIEPAAWDFIELEPSLLEMVKEAKALVFGSLGQRNALSRKTIEQLRKYSAFNVFDVNLRPPFDKPGIVESSLKDAHLIKLNDDELVQLTDWFDLPESFKDAVIALAAKFQCQTVCVTKGADGAVLWNKGVWSEHPGYSVDIHDTVGSGDAFLAAFLSGFLSKKEDMKILDFANATGAYVATCRGATPLLDLKKITLIQDSRN